MMRTAPLRRALGLALLIVVPCGHAVGANPLDQFLKGLQSFRASFSQTVNDAHGHSVEQSTGTLIVLRPGRFRWEIHTQGQSGEGQLVIDDGRNLWYYDRDLQQVTVRPAGNALSATPAMLLSQGDTLSQFQVQDAGTQRGLGWVRVVPKAADADFKEALLGFAGDELKRMILKDKLGQTATLDFEHTERNVQVSASEVSFTVPAGADVIGTPEK